MEKVRSDQVVLFIDQQNPKSPLVETELQQQRQNALKQESPSFSASQNPTRIKNLRRLSFSKPKARLLEFNAPTTGPKAIPESTEIEPFSENNDSSTDEDDDDEWDNELEEDDGDVGKKNHRKKKKKFNWRLLVELVLFFIIMTGLIGSLSIKSIKNKRRWGLEIWKWCVMVMVTFCGRLVSAWVMGFAVFLIERNFMLREKVLYFVYGLRKSIQNCIWLGLVLLAWTCMFNGKVQKKNKILQNVFRALVAVLLGATIWLIKIILVKVLASSFHVTTYFDRMKESVFHHYILETLSGPPMDEFVTEEKQNHDLRGSKSLPANWNEGKSKEARNNLKLKKFGSRKIDMEKLKKLSMERTASAWSVKRLASYITSSGLSTISKTVDDFGKSESEITSEWEARSCAQKIFKNVANPGAK